MALPTSRLEFIEYIKNKLGEEYISVDLSDNNWDSIINEAVSFFHEYVYEFSKDVVYALDVTYGELEYNLPSDIYAVYEILEKQSILNFYLGFPSKNFTPGMHEFWASFGKLGGSQFVDAEVLFENLNLFYQVFVPKTDYEYNSIENKLYLRKYPPTSTTIYMFVNKLIDFDGTGGSNAWGDRNFINYATILAELQWARNMRKFKTDGMTLPGGITLNFDTIYAEAKQDKKDFEEYATTKLVNPIWGGIIIG